MWRALPTHDLSSGGTPDEGETPRQPLDKGEAKNGTQDMQWLADRILQFDRRGIYTLLMIAETFEKERQYNKAEQCCRTALAAIDHFNHSVTWRCDALADLASALLHQGRFAEAESTLRQAYELADGQPLDLLTCWQIARSLEQLMEVQGKASEAAEWGARADTLIRGIAEKHFGPPQ